MTRRLPLPIDRIGELVSAATYGTVLVFAALSLISANQISAGVGAELIAGVGLATWVAHLYAELLAGHVHRQRPLTRSEVRRALVDGSPILASTVLPASALLLGHLDLVSDSIARAMAIALSLAQLLAIGLVVGHLAPARQTARWILRATYPFMRFPPRPTRSGDPVERSVEHAAEDVHRWC